ncbi:MAG: GHKL domain-containing protein [Solobacterium sp.]|jgi:hypothetical protein|nr:GHKL domain-containing protein [Solobacterium sp.]
MNTVSSFTNSLVQMLIMVPVAIVAFVPLIQHTSSYWKRLTLFVGIAAALAFISALLFTAAVSVRLSVWLAAGLGVMFVIYLKLSKTTAVKSIAIFLWAVTLMSCPFALSFTMDASVNPAAVPYALSTRTALLRLVIGCAIAIIFYIVANHNEVLLVESEFLTGSHWFITIPVSGIFLFLNLLMIPRTTEKLRNAAVLRVYLSYVTFSFSLYILMYIIFRMFSMEFIENAKAREERHFLAVQESEYLSLQQNMEQMRRFCHDMRHSFISLQEMADRNDVEGIKKYLHEYQKMIPNMKVQNYTANHAVNAVLNHYNSLAVENHIFPVLQINIPTELNIPDPSLCSMIGNLFENAIEGCETIPEEQRKLSLSAIVKDNATLFILTTNTFDGNVKMLNGKYQSTKRKNGGVGTTSVATITKKYGGTAEFHHDSSQFYVDIMIPVTLMEHSEPETQGPEQED